MGSSHFTFSFIVLSFIVFIRLFFYWGHFGQHFNCNDLLIISFLAFKNIINFISPLCFCTIKSQDLEASDLLGLFSSCEHHSKMDSVRLGSISKVKVIHVWETWLDGEFFFDWKKEIKQWHGTDKLLIILFPIFLCFKAAGRRCFSEWNWWHNIL